MPRSGARGSSREAREARSDASRFRFAASRAVGSARIARFYVCKLLYFSRIIDVYTGVYLRLIYNTGSGAKRVSFQCFTCRRRCVGNLVPSTGQTKSSSSPPFFFDASSPATLAMIFAVSAAATAEASPLMCSARIDAAWADKRAMPMLILGRGRSGQSGGGHSGARRGGDGNGNERPRTTRGSRGTHFRSCAMDSSSCANSRVVEGMSRGMVDVETREHSPGALDTARAPGTCAKLQGTLFSAT